MAEGTVKQVVTEYKETPTDICLVCREDDNFKKTSWYCQQCRQQLCDMCQNYHSKLSSTMRHVMVRTDEIPNISSPSAPKSASDEFRAPICHSHDLPVEFFCQKHNAPACNTCKLLDHRNCQLQDLEHAAATGTPRRNLEVLYRLREIETQMKDTGEIFGKEKKELDLQKNVAIESIEKKMKHIEVLGQEKKTILQNIFKQEHESLDRETQALTQSQVLVEKSIKALERATEVGSEEEIFVATMMAEKDVPKFQDILKESEKVPHKVIDFAIDSRLADITSIGDVKKSSIAMGHSPNVIELLNTKQCRKYYQWLDVLPCEQLILLSYQPKSQLSLYSASGMLLSKLDLPSAISAATLNAHQIIVSLREVGQLQIVNIASDVLKKGTVIKVGVQPILILEYTASSVFIFAKKRDGNGYFQILDLAGHIKKSTTVDFDLQDPLFMRMNPEKNVVYIVDGDEGCFGFDLNGGMIWHFNQSCYDQYWGLAVDQRGALYLTAIESAQYPATSLMKLSPAGHVLNQRSLTIQYPLMCTEDKLYLIGINSQEEKVVSYIFI